MLRLNLLLESDIGLFDDEFAAWCCGRSIAKSRVASTDTICETKPTPFGSGATALGSAGVPGSSCGGGVPKDSDVTLLGLAGISVEDLDRPAMIPRCNLRRRGAKRRHAPLGPLHNSRPVHNSRHACNTQCQAGCWSWFVVEGSIIGRISAIVSGPRGLAHRGRPGTMARPRAYNR
jgi:hypothetical protein